LASQARESDSLALAEALHAGLCWSPSSA
jgi:hypothetical protein